MSVNSVFGRTGDVVAQSGDYSLSQIGGVNLASPAKSQVLLYNGTNWTNQNLTVSVQAYGATGNGSTDDTTAIQNAITAVVNAGGGTVFFPPGNYKISSTLNVQGGGQTCRCGLG
jgi:Pectate lyase superfamily protein